VIFFDGFYSLLDVFSTSFFSQIYFIPFAFIASVVYYDIAVFIFLYGVLFSVGFKCFRPYLTAFEVTGLFSLECFSFSLAISALCLASRASTSNL